MAITTYDQLPVTLSLAGNEITAIYVPSGLAPPLPQWVTQRCTTAQIAQLVSGSAGSSVTMRQLLAALAADSLLVTLFEAVPADITNQYNIAYWHATKMTLTDPFITGFLQPTLSYSALQVQTLFTLALTFPA